jgi:hypothetical protein
VKVRVLKTGRAGMAISITLPEKLPRVFITILYGPLAGMILNMTAKSTGDLFTSIDKGPKIQWRNG